MKEFFEDKINLYAEAIIKGSDKRDAHALGELTFYMAMRRVIKGEATRQDIGMIDAINDTLQEAKILVDDKTFVAYMK
jgi:hypothetical protein